MAGLPRIQDPKPSFDLESCSELPPTELVLLVVELQVEPLAGLLAVAVHSYQPELG